MNQKIFARLHYSLLQKGFWEKILNCVEHIQALTYIISNAQLKQKDCVITLLDLKNAFGEVNHHLLIETLKLHHITDDIITLISSLYSNYDISILTDSFMASPIRVHRGFLQGDSLSLLLFNLIINTPINTIKSEKIECMGYFYQNCLRPKYWFHFADDTAIVTTLKSDNQHLCNVFLKWTSWADLTIKVSKCHTLGIRKNKAASEQFQPCITVRKQRFLPVEQDKSFTYLEKDFNFKMNRDKMKVELQSEIRKYVETIDKLPIKFSHKIEIMQR